MLPNCSIKPGFALLNCSTAMSPKFPAKRGHPQARFSAKPAFKPFKPSQDKTEVHKLEKLMGHLLYRFFGFHAHIFPEKAHSKGCRCLNRKATVIKSYMPKCLSLPTSRAILWRGGLI
jgi:hypothetical protein